MYEELLGIMKTATYTRPAWCAMLTMELQPAVHMQHMGHGLAAGDQHHQILMPNNQMHMQHQEDENKKKQRDYRHQMPYESEDGGHGSQSGMSGDVESNFGLAAKP
ncbi:uncharacterized protein LOC113376327 [Ctenocephalides felis]|uniref:uncharacterized protein LOC113376327 n=1 Tax=Ctenocephalides felis TaxID=7515 RepID=UPI000E6E3D41|nr:uncharacterized protein LOC113376327 [Ctenocephalides felis]